MTLVVVGLGVVLVMVVVVTRVARTTRGAVPTPAELDRSGSGAWLSEARSVVRDGRRLATELEEPIEAFELDGRTYLPSDLERHVEVVAHQLVELTRTAPTPMDVRVCRGLSIRTRTLADTIGSVDDATVRPGRAPVDRRELAARYAAFVEALTDLDEHVELL